jgi:hypothetical protein
MKRVARTIALVLALTALAAPGLAAADQDWHRQDGVPRRGAYVAPPPHFGGVGPGFVTPHHSVPPPYVVYRQPHWVWQPGFWQWNGQGWLWTPSRWVQVFPRY